VAQASSRAQQNNRRLSQADLAVCQQAAALEKFSPVRVKLTVKTSCEARGEYLRAHFKQ
jgi:hypothetical protein